MNVADRTIVVDFIEMLAFELSLPPTRGNLRRLAWATVMGELRRMAENHQELQCVDRTRSQHVVISEFDIYFLSQLPIGQIFTDFPQYRRRNGVELNVVNDTYYRVDRVIRENTGLQPNQHLTKAIIGPCTNFRGGQPFQQIKFLDASGTETNSGLHRVNFAWPIDT